MTDQNLLLDNFDPVTVPDKFKDNQNGTIRLQTLIDSYNNLEKKMSGASHSAAPQSHEEYCITCDHGMFEPDAEINKRLHEKGMSEDQVQTVYDLAAERMLPMIADLAADFQADREVEKLINHFGGQQKWKEVSRQLLSFGRKNLPADVLDGLSSSYEGILALHRMMKSGEPGLQTGASPAAGIGEKDLQSMMRNPKYWKDKDPAFVEKVTQGFQNMYGE